MYLALLALGSFLLASVHSQQTNLCNVDSDTIFFENEQLENLRRSFQTGGECSPFNVGEELDNVIEDYVKNGRELSDLSDHDQEVIRDLKTNQRTREDLRGGAASFKFPTENGFFVRGKQRSHDIARPLNLFKPAKSPQRLEPTNMNRGEYVGYNDQRPLLKERDLFLAEQEKKWPPLHEFRPFGFPHVQDPEDRFYQRDRRWPQDQFSSEGRRRQQLDPFRPNVNAGDFVNGDGFINNQNQRRPDSNQRPPFDRPNSRPNENFAPNGFSNGGNSFSSNGASRPFNDQKRPSIGSSFGGNGNLNPADFSNDRGQNSFSSSGQGGQNQGRPGSGQRRPPFDTFDNSGNFNSEDFSNGQNSFTSSNQGRPQTQRPSDNGRRRPSDPFRPTDTFTSNNFSNEQGPFSSNSGSNRQNQRRPGDGQGSSSFDSFRPNGIDNFGETSNGNGFGLNQNRPDFFSDDGGRRQNQNRPGTNPSRPGTEFSDGSDMGFPLNSGNPRQTVVQRPQTSTTSRPTQSTTLPGPPTWATAPSVCVQRCPNTPEYNPVCGSDRVTYNNPGRLRCEQGCGKASLRLNHYGQCQLPRVGAIPPRPLQTNNATNTNNPAATSTTPRNSRRNNQRTNRRNNSRRNPDSSFTLDY